MSGLAQPLGRALRQFQAVRSRLVARMTLVRLLWVALALSLLFVYLDMMLAFPAVVRVVLDLMFMGALGATLWFTRRRWAQPASDGRMVARLVESGNPDLGNELVSAIDFADRMKPGADPAASADLMEAEIKLAAEKAVKIRNLQPLRPESLRNDQRALAATLLVAAIFSVFFFDAIQAIAPRFLNPAGDNPPYSPTQLAIEPEGAHVDYGDDLTIRATARGPQPEAMTLVTERADGTPISELPMFIAGEGHYRQTLENIREEFTYYVKIPDTRSRKQRLALTRTPRIESVYAGYAPPEYAHKRKENRVLDEPLVRGLAGTQVTLTLTSNRPLREGSVKIGGRDVALVPDKENSVAGTFTIEEEAEFAASITDVDGLICKEPYKGRIEITPDNAPRINFVGPGMDSFAIPDAKIPLVIEADDDLGISRVDLFRAHNGSEDSKKTVHTSVDGETFSSVVETLDLADLGVQPGDTIDYYAMASDTHPGGANSAASPAFRLMIISKEEYAQFMQTQMTAEDVTNKYNAILDQMAELAREQEQLRVETEALEKKIAEQGGPTPEDEAKAAELKERQEAIVKKADELRKQLEEEAKSPATFDIEKDYKRELEQMAQRLKEAGEAMSQSGGELAQAAGQTNQPGQNPDGSPKENQQAGQPGEQSPPQAGQNPMNGALQNSLAKQKAALDQMGQNVQQFQEGIQQANEELEKMERLVADVEQFKNLYSLQRETERHARSFRENPAPNLDEQIRLKELGEKQADIREDLAQLKEDFREHAKAVEADHAQIAKDAREIADQIEKRMIESTMGAASEKLGEARGREGHEQSRAARDQMEGMITRCQSMGGQGGQCEERLKIQMESMGMKLGNTLGQMGQRFSRGSSAGQGAGGQFGMFGNDKTGRKRAEESSLGRKDAQADHGKAVEPDPLSGNIEELDAGKAHDLELGAVGGERFIEEYKPLVEAYFQGLAEEGQ